MAHTPGEWFYDERTESIGFAGGWLGSTRGREGEGLGDQHDDGQLMAAAPLLLVALEVVEWITHTGSGGQRCPWCQGTYPDHKPACMRQAAIAAAKLEDAVTVETLDETVPGWMVCEDQFETYDEM